MKLALEIINREIAQRQLANKHDHLRKDICTKEIEELQRVVNLLSIPVVVFNESDKTKTQQKENIVAIMQADEKDGIYKSEVELSCKCPICGKEMTSQVVKHHHCKECKENFTTT